MGFSLPLHGEKSTRTRSLEELSHELDDRGGSRDGEASRRESAQANEKKWEKVSVKLFEHVSRGTYHPLIDRALREVAAFINVVRDGETAFAYYRQLRDTRVFERGRKGGRIRSTTRE